MGSDNLGGQFKFKVGQRVWLQRGPGAPVSVRIKARTIEAALGKTYWCVSRRQSYGYQPEERISDTPPARA